MGTTLLQIFLVLNVFIIGVLVTIGAQHLYAHLHPQKKQVRQKGSDFQLSAAMREHLIAEAQAHFQIVTNKGANDLARKLDGASDGMVSELHKVGEQAVLRQAQTYESAQSKLIQAAEEALATVQKTATEEGSSLQQKTDEYMTRLDSELDKLARERKEHILFEIDAKVSDAVVSFLLETLGHEVDLGAQLPYILARLDENKEALKKEVGA